MPQPRALSPTCLGSRAARPQAAWPLCLVHPAASPALLPLGDTTLALSTLIGLVVGVLAGALVYRRLARREAGDENTLEAERLSAAVAQARDAVVITDTSGTIQYVNPAFEALTGYTAAQAVGQNPRILRSGKHEDDFYRELWETIASGQIWSGRVVNRRKDGEHNDEEMTISPVRDATGTITSFIAIKRDITEKVLLERQLDQAQRLEAIGQLAAGIAHEINTPTQYVGDNTRFLQDSFVDLEPLLAACTKLAEEPVDAQRSTQCDTIKAAVEQADVTYLREEVPRAIGESLEGIARIAKIVRAMKEFSHPGVEESTSVDLNHAIEQTITVATNEWKYVATVDTDFDPDLPSVTCHPGAINQVVLNMIVNAAHAIGDVVEGGSDERGTITVSTRLDGDWVEIRVSDTGTGIAPEIQDRIFDPFFTTKEVGKGTGQGLSIAHSIVTQKHDGSIALESEVGKGTTFIVRLPIASAEEPVDAPAPEPAPEAAPLEKVR